MSSDPNTLITAASGSTSQATAAFGAQTYHIRVATAGATAVYVKIDDGTPVADSTGGSMLVGLNQINYFVVTPGQKAALLPAGAAATVTVTEMS
jgi:hypothetical protein